MLASLLKNEFLVKCGFNESNTEFIATVSLSRTLTYLIFQRTQESRHGLPRGVSGKEPACQCRRHNRHGFDPWVGRIPWRRKWHPLQYSFLGNPKDRGAWRATVHGVAESDMTERLSTQPKGKQSKFSDASLSPKPSSHHAD